jgi:hypothetical protein
LLLVPENMSTWDVVLCSCIVGVEGNDAKKEIIIIYEAKIRVGGVMRL